MADELIVDSRGRASFAKVRRHHFNRYRVYEDANGVMTLTPLITISSVEAAALADPVVREAVAAANAGDRSQVRPRRRRVTTSAVAPDGVQG
jgi:hypothetical protein